MLRHYAALTAFLVIFQIGETVLAASTDEICSGSWAGILEKTKSSRGIRVQGFNHDLNLELQVSEPNPANGKILERALIDRKELFLQCYRESFEGRKLYGKLNLSVDVDPDGNVSKIGIIEDGLKDRNLNGCILSKLKKIRLYSSSAMAMNANVNFKYCHYE
jgi:hypothetical protein